MSFGQIAHIISTISLSLSKTIWIFFIVANSWTFLLQKGQLKLESSIYPGLIFFFLIGRVFGYLTNRLILHQGEARSNFLASSIATIFWSIFLAFMKEHRVYNLLSKFGLGISLGINMDIAG